MTEQERDILAALLHNEFVVHEDEDFVPEPCGLCGARAARLIAAGVRAAPSPDAPCDGCEVCVGEIDDCGCVIGHEHTCAPSPDAPLATPPDGLQPDGHYIVHVAACEVCYPAQSEETPR